MQRTAWQRLTLGLAASLGLQVACVGAAFAADDVLRIDQRFANEAITENPDFRQHVVPLMGKLGCNGRACHGSFQTVTAGSHPDLGTIRGKLARCSRACPSAARHAAENRESR